MKTIILCGGTGTRLKEETEFKPKPMVNVGGKPILWHIMKIYAEYGYTEFVLALGYKADYIKEFFLNQRAFLSDFTLKTFDHTISFHDRNTDKDMFTIDFVNTGVDTQIGERILLCEPYIPKKDTHFMVTYGDGVADINIKKLVAYHRKQKTIGTVTGVHPRSKYGLLSVNGKNRITGIQEKPILSDWVNGGYMVFNRKFFSYLKPNEMEHPALSRLVSENQLSLFSHNGFWYAVDTYKELEELNQLWQQTNPPWKVWK